MVIIMRKRYKHETKPKLTDEEKRFLLKNSKLKTLQELAEILNKDEKQIKNICTRIGCGYMTKLKTK